MDNKTPTNIPKKSDADTALGTVLGCGIVTIVLVLLWLRFSVHAAHEDNLANHIEWATNGGSFLLWFFYWSLYYLIFFLIPALPIGWLICGTIGWTYAPRPKSDVLVEKPSVNTLWQHLLRLSLSISAGGFAGGVLVWVVVSFVTGAPLWFLQML